MLICVQCVNVIVGIIYCPCVILLAIAYRVWVITDHSLMTQFPIHA